MSDGPKKYCFSCTSPVWCVCVRARVLNSGHIVSDNYLTAGSLQTSLLSGFSIIVLERLCPCARVHECECVCM